MLLSCFSKGRQSEDGRNVTVSPLHSSEDAPGERQLVCLCPVTSAFPRPNIASHGDSENIRQLEFYVPQHKYLSNFFLPLIELKILETVLTGAFVILQCVLSQTWSAVKLGLVLSVKICCEKQ